MQKKIDKIIIRVYALIIYKDRILVSDEFWYDTPMTKFPGGGLEPGEGIIDCLRRELMEELGVIPAKEEHFYTCEQMIASEFIPFTQVVPIYFRVELKDYSLLKVSEYRYDFKQLENGAISLRWMDLSLLDESELTFTGDKEALSVLRKKYALSRLK